MILIKPAGFVGFLNHAFVGLESLDVRYYFLSKAWRDRRRLTSNILTFHLASAENRREKSLRVYSWVCCFCFNIILLT